jgi:hypothetical protein
MARRVFFSFHYDRDVWRANQVRNANVVLGTDTAGFFDHSEYLKAKAQGDDAIRRMILGHLNNTSVTVVLIGTLTWTRPWVQFEIKESLGGGTVCLASAFITSRTRPGSRLRRASRRTSRPGCSSQSTHGLFPLGGSRPRLKRRDSGRMRGSGGRARSSLTYWKGVSVGRNEPDDADMRGSHRTGEMNTRTKSGPWLLRIVPGRQQR